MELEIEPSRRRKQTLFLHCQFWAQAFQAEHLCCHAHAHEISKQANKKHCLMFYQGCSEWRLLASPLPQKVYLELGKGPATKSDEFSEKRQRGGGSFSIQKFILQILGTLISTFWSWNWYKIVISGFRVCFFNNGIDINWY